MSAAAAIAARLKLKRKVDDATSEENAAAPPDLAAPAAPPTKPLPRFAEGATVLGNFKGMGDWDEALVVGLLADGTYVLEYTDEGLLEEGVPESRIRPFDDGDVHDSGAMTTSGAGDKYRVGEFVMGNFKDLGDWDEARVVSVAEDGTYVLEYIDEGLIEEGVPPSRICHAGGHAEVEAEAAMANAEGGSSADLATHTQPSAVQRTPNEGEVKGGFDHSSDQRPEEVLASDAEFVACLAWVGCKPGWCFKTSAAGLGYHRDVPLHEVEEAAERARMVLTAAQLANWSVELLGARPSVDKVDRFMGLHHLEALRVTAVSAGKGERAPPPLFDSLESWFEDHRSLLATRVPLSAIEVTLRVFLAPKQNLDLGLQQVTFAIDWMRVGAAAGAEPLSSALLRRMGLEGRRPQKMLLVVMCDPFAPAFTHACSLAFARARWRACACACIEACTCWPWRVLLRFRWHLSRTNSCLHATTAAPATCCMPARARQWALRAHDPAHALCAAGTAPR